jgi:hypothetical protein
MIKGKRIVSGNGEFKREWEGDCLYCYIAT